MTPRHQACRCRQCFIPPYLTERLLRSSDSRVRERAIADLAFASESRSERQLQVAVGWRPTVRASTTDKQRIVYVAGAHGRLPGRPARAEGDPDTGDAAIDEAYRYSGDVWDFYHRLFGRHSIDGRGMPLVSTVHLCAPDGGPLDNGFWTGRQMAYGDGDGVVFGRFTRALDVVGHELTHGLQAFTSRLDYDGEPGALNEHFADVFGILAKQWTLGLRAEQSDWLVGADVLLPLPEEHRPEGISRPRINGEPLVGTQGRPVRRGIRDMLNPGTAFRQDPVLGDDPQPSHMTGLYRGPQDHGGVHLNSGIPNRAFALTACAIGGYAWEIAGRIWFDSMLTLQPRSGFTDCARATIRAARGFGQVAEQATRYGWASVGVFIEGTPTGNTPTVIRS